MKLTCKKCDYSWTPRNLSPKACPACKRYDWNKKVSSAQSMGEIPRNKEGVDIF